MHRFAVHALFASAALVLPAAPALADRADIERASHVDRFEGLSGVIVGLGIGLVVFGHRLRHRATSRDTVAAR